MEVTHPRFEEYKARFDELAFLADEVRKPEPPLDECAYYLCLFGENGMSAEDEFAFLDKMDAYVGKGLKKVVVETSYWEDTVLFVP